MELRINQEFQALIPPLSAEELAGLESSILLEGCRDALTIWDSYIIDGHNRYAICKKHDVPFDTKEVSGLESELDVKLWMINNQFSRRNLSIETRLALAYKFKEFEAEKAKVRQLAGVRIVKVDEENNETDNLAQLVGQGAENKNITRERGALGEIAKRAGVSHTTAEQYDAIQRKGTEEQKQAVSNGEASIKKVYNTIQRAERLEKNKATEWPEGKYRVIYADPPWQYSDERSGGSYGGAIDHYDTMSIEELCKMPVLELAEENAVLFLWATTPLFPEALQLVSAWGFTYKTNIIWDKVKPNMGNYTMVAHEHLILATKGSCTPDNTKRFNSIQTIEKTSRHSEKPEEFRNIIETLYTYGNKLELFARKKVEGWEAYGNEI